MDDKPMIQLKHLGSFKMLARLLILTVVVVRSSDDEHTKVEVEEGERVVLTCDNKNKIWRKPLSSVDWFKMENVNKMELFLVEYQKFPARELYKIHSDVKDRFDTMLLDHTILRINKTNITDEGLYKCSVAYEGGSDQLYFELTVMQPTPPNFYTTPGEHVEFTSRDSNINATGNTSIKPQTHNLTIALAVGLSCGIILVLAIVAIVFFVRRWKKKTDGANTPLTQQGGPDTNPRSEPSPADQLLENQEANRVEDQDGQDIYPQNEPSATNQLLENRQADRVEDDANTGDHVDEMETEFKSPVGKPNSEWPEQNTSDISGSTFTPTTDGEPMNLDISIIEEDSNISDHGTHLKSRVEDEPDYSERPEQYATCSDMSATGLSQEAEGEPRNIEPEAAKQWRNMEFSDANWDRLMKYVREIEVPEGVESLNILVIGRVGHGKSSFITTCNTSMITDKAKGIQQPGRLLIGTGESSITDRFRGHAFPNEKGQEMRFRLYDTKGLSQRVDEELSSETVTYILQGHIKDGYSFENNIKESKYFRPNPTVKDRIHCVAVCIEATQITDTDATPIIKFLKSLKDDIYKQEINMYILVTKIDNICTRTDANTEYALQSPEIEDVINIITQLLGIQKNKVYPLRNYVEQKQRDRGIEILALDAMQNMLDNACGYASACMRSDE